MNYITWGITTWLPPSAPMSLPEGFLLLPNPKFPCRDIREEQLEKTVAYVQVLQFWAEKSNPPTTGQPHLLAGSILELREVMESYISFHDDAVLDGVAPPEGFLKDQSEETIPESALLASPDSPIEEATVEETTPVGGPLEEPSTPQTLCEEQTMRVEASQIQFPGCRKVLHPSGLITATGQVPPVSHESRWRPCSQSSRGRKA